jgi:hypothetical protein
VTAHIDKLSDLEVTCVEWRPGRQLRIRGDEEPVQFDFGEETALREEAGVFLGEELRVRSSGAHQQQPSPATEPLPVVLVHHRRRDVLHHVVVHHLYIKSRILLRSGVNIPKVTPKVIY